MSLSHQTPREDIAISHSVQNDNREAQDLKYRTDAANYVAAMLAELRQIAGKAGFDKLVKALDSAYYEAYSANGEKAKAASDEDRKKVSSDMEPGGEEHR